MNIDFELYKVFYTVANNLNITKAAEELHISQPAISKSIKNLESQLGGQLFVRTKRGVILTEEGKEFYNYIKQAMDFIYNAESKFTDLINLETGTIKIGISTTLTKQFLLPYLKIFHEKFPKINIQIDTSISNELIKKLRNGLIDVVFINLPINNYDKDLQIIECKTINDCFVVNEQYKYLTKENLSLQNLNQYPLIFQNSLSITRTFLNDFIKKNDIVLEPTFQLASYSLIVEFTKMGMGIGYLTKEYIEKEIENKELFVLNVTPAIPSRHIGLITSKTHLPSFSTNKLIEIIKQK